MTDQYITDQDIINFFITSKGKINSNYVRNIDKYPQYKEYLLNRFVDEKCIKHIIWRIYYKQEIRNVCPICGNITSFDKNYVKQTDLVYRKYCCSKCAALSKERNEKYKDTCINKYGVENPLQLDDIRNKALINAQSEKSKIKRKNTNIERYGGTGLGSIKIANKIKSTIQEKYGMSYPIQNKNIKNKIQNTIKQKYNSDWIVTSEEFKEKSKITCIERYGVDNYRKTKENIEKSHSADSINKCIITKRNNNSFNISKTENETYNILINFFGKDNVITQYKSKEYPFCCDFYIKTISLYIECNYHWTHGFHPFDVNNKNDVKKLNLWKSKQTKYYINAINTWTIRDVNKRNIAKKNNLNYIEFFSIDEFKKFIYELEYDNRRINT